MQLVLDSNEYIFAIGLPKKRSCELLLDKIFAIFPAHTIRLPRMIVEEIKNNLTPEGFKEFIGLITSVTSIDEDILIPFELGVKYELQGLKQQDAFIAAYTEWTGAEVLVTENRHFLTRHSHLPFKILTAESCLKIL